MWSNNNAKNGHSGNPYNQPISSVLLVAKKPYSSTSKKVARLSTVVWFGLNVLRIISLVALSLVIASQIVAGVSDIKAIQADKKAMKVIRQAVLSGDATIEDDWECDYYQYSSVPTQAGGEFWSISNRIFIIFQCLVLFLSELSLPIGIIQRAFELHLPILSENYGLGFLGVVQVIIGCSVLSKYVNKFEQVAGWMLVIVGSLNSIVGIGFRSSAKHKRLVFKWGKTLGDHRSSHGKILSEKKSLADEYKGLAQQFPERISNESSDTLVESPQIARAPPDDGRKAYVEPELELKAVGKPRIVAPFIGPRIVVSPVTFPSSAALPKVTFGGAGARHVHVKVKRDQDSQGSSHSLTPVR